MFEFVWVAQAMIRRHCIQYEKWTFYELNEEHLLVVTMFSFFLRLENKTNFQIFAQNIIDDDNPIYDD